MMMKVTMKCKEFMDRESFIKEVIEVVDFQRTFLRRSKTQIFNEQVSYEAMWR